MMKIWSWLVLILLLVACSQATETIEPDPTNTATNTPVPTDTSVPPTDEPPTATVPPPTDTPVPTDTPIPTDTPQPIPTLEPTDTPVPYNSFSADIDLKEALTLVSDDPVIEREFRNKYLNGGAVIFHDGEFHLFSNYFDNWPAPTISYYFNSPDGEVWTRTIEEPLFGVENVPFDVTAALVLDGLILPDGTWVLYYHTFTANNRPGFIGRISAPSPTGPWTFDETPTLSPGSDGEWDDLQVMRVNVLPTDEGYVMYYAGVSKRGESRIGRAFSADAITFEKYDDPATTDAPYAESDPIFEPLLSWEGKWVGRPEVVQSPDGWVMLYEGGARGSKTGIAISTDGMHFDRYDGNPLLTQENMVKSFPFFQGAFFYHDNTYYYLIEAGNGRIGTDIFLYTLPAPLLPAE